MPRGWLKHKNRVVGEKASRGGSSRTNTPKYRNSSSKSKSVQLILDEDDFVSYNEDIHILSDHEREDESAQTRSKTTKMECPICCEHRPLISLMAKCNHPPACYECLREIYVKQAQKDVTNYPLQCFYPSCRKPVRDKQLILHGLVRCKDELKKHHRFTTLAKAYAKPETNKIAHCPDCDEPRAVNTHNCVRCRECKAFFFVAREGVTHEFTTISAMQSLMKDRFGPNDGVAKCPSCRIIISKGWGCDHMTCICGHEFSWDVARQKLGSLGKIAHAKSIG